jgi:hypothetical protein
MRGWAVVSKKEIFDVNFATKNGGSLPSVTVHDHLVDVMTRSSGDNGSCVIGVEHGATSRSPEPRVIIPKTVIFQAPVGLVAQFLVKELSRIIEPDFLDSYRSSSSGAGVVRIFEKLYSGSCERVLRDFSYVIFSLDTAVFLNQGFRVIEKLRNPQVDDRLLKQ